MVNNKIGRPRKYKDVNELQQLIDEYFQICDETKRPYTITGLALFLDMDRRTLLRYEKDYEDEFCLTIMRAKERVQEFVECCLFKKGIANGVMFNLKNNFGWEDKQTVQHSGEINNPYANLTEEELRKIANDS